MRKFSTLMIILVLGGCVSISPKKSTWRAPSGGPDLHIGLLGGIHLAEDFGYALSENLSKHGEVTRFAVKGVATYGLLRTSTREYKSGYVRDNFIDSHRVSVDEGRVLNFSRDLLDEFLEKDYDVLLLQAMDFELNIKESQQEQHIDAVTQLLQLLEEKSERCYFVTTAPKSNTDKFKSITNAKKAKFVEEVLKPAIAESDCRIVDSFELLGNENIEIVNSDNGLSVDKSSSKVWANTVTDFITEDLGLDESEVVDSAQESLNIGIFGESHTAQAFGNRLVKNLSKKGEVSRFAVAGMNTMTALESSETKLNMGSVKDKTLNERVLSQVRVIDEYTQRKTKPNGPIEKTAVSKKITEDFLDQNFDVIILQFMDNQVNFESVTSARETVRDMADLAEGYAEHCYYVSATYKNVPAPGKKEFDWAKSVTDAQKIKYVDEVLKPVLKDHKCKFINSLDVMKQKEVFTVDGLHLHSPSGNTWGERTAKLILEDLSGVAPLAQTDEEEVVQSHDCSDFDQTGSNFSEEDHVACVSDSLRSHRAGSETPTVGYDFGSSDKGFTVFDTLKMVRGFKSFYNTKKAHCMTKVTYDGEEYFTAAKYVQKTKDCKYTDGSVQYPTQEQVDSHVKDAGRPIKNRRGIDGIYGRLKLPLGNCSRYSMNADDWREQRSGYKHPGQDINAPDGEPVRAIYPGVVVETIGHCEDNYPSGSAACSHPTIEDRGFGNRVMLMHVINGEVWYSGYHHLRQPLNVRKGQRVPAGYKVGEVGSTGVSGSFHLHFEIMEGGSGASHYRNDPSIYYPDGKFCESTY